MVGRTPVVGVLVLTAIVPGVVILVTGNLCPDMATEPPGVVGRTPVEGVEVVKPVGVESSAGRVCGVVTVTPDILILTAVEDTTPVDVTGPLPGRREGEANLCPDAAVTLGELVLTPIGAETLCPGVDSVLDVLGPAVPGGVTNRWADALVTLGVLTLGVVALSPVDGVLLLGPDVYVGRRVTTELGVVVRWPVTEVLVFTDEASGGAAEAADDLDPPGGRNAG